MRRSLKRRSATKPPEDYTFFTDRDLGTSIPEAIREAGYSVIAHDTVFPDAQNTEDRDWLERVGAEGWLALSHNYRIRNEPDEIDMAMRAGVALFFLIGKRHEDLVTNLRLTLPRIIRFRKNNKPPFVAKVHRPEKPDDFGKKAGRVSMWVTEEQWRLGKVKAGPPRA